jgi:hypothetical protein
MGIILKLKNVACVRCREQIFSKKRMRFENREVTPLCSEN